MPDVGVGVEAGGDDGGVAPREAVAREGTVPGGRVGPGDGKGGVRGGGGRWEVAGEVDIVRNSSMER